MAQTWPSNDHYLKHSPSFCNLAKHTATIKKAIPSFYKVKWTEFATAHGLPLDHTKGYISISHLSQHQGITSHPHFTRPFLNMLGIGKMFIVRTLVDRLTMSHKWRKWKWDFSRSWYVSWTVTICTLYWLMVYNAIYLFRVALQGQVVDKPVESQYSTGGNVEHKFSTMSFDLCKFYNGYDFGRSLWLMESSSLSLSFWKVFQMATIWPNFSSKFCHLPVFIPFPMHLISWEMRIPWLLLSSRLSESGKHAPPLHPVVTWLFLLFPAFTSFYVLNLEKMTKSSKAEKAMLPSSGQSLLAIGP